MEVRKLMAFGNSSYVVSLPKAWVAKNKLKKGDSLIVEERPSEIVFSAQETDRAKKLREVTMSLQGKDIEEIKTEILSYYVNNADVITLTHVDKSHAGKVKAILHSLVGMEVIEETTSRIVAKDLLDVKAFTIPGTLRRTDIIIRSMLDDSIHAKKDLIESIYDRDKEVNRLVLLASRTVRAAMENPLLLRQFDMTYWEVLMSKQITNRMEFFADQVKRVSKLLPEAGKQEKNLVSIYKKIKDHYYDIMKIYYAKNKEAAIKKETSTRNLMKECNEFLDKHTSELNIKIVEHFKYMVVGMTGILRSIMEMNL